MPQFTQTVEELDTYIGQAFDQVLYDGCEVALNGRFWNEYRCIRNEVSRELQASGASGNGYTTSLKAAIVTRLSALGWIAFINSDGCIEFYKTHINLY